MKNTSARKLTKFQEGFTLIELLVVIGILAVLLAITLIAINPARQFAQANDTKRKSAATQILNAVGAYMADNRGNYPAALTASSSGEVSNTGINICADLVPNYMPALPQDPRNNNGADITSCTTYNSGYTITRNLGRVTVTADSEVNPNVDTDITVTR